MKKISLILSIVLLAVSLTACKKDSDNTPSVVELPPIELYETDEFVSIGIENGFRYTEYSDHIEITDCYNASTVAEVSFPAVIAGKPVTVIDVTSFRTNVALESVSFPDTVQEIGNNMFAYCSSLAEVKMSENVKKIGYYAFFETPWFKALDDEFVVVGDGVLIKYNGDDSDVVLPQNVKYLSSAFIEISSINSITLPSSVTGICDYAFYGCSSLGEINVPSHISDIGICAFDKTPWITLSDDEFVTAGNSVLISYNGDGGEVVIPDGIKYIAGAFQENNTITSVVVPESVIRVRGSSFQGCKKLEKVEFKGADTFLDDSVFANCYTLSSVTLPAALKVLERQTFLACYALADIRLPDSLEFIGRVAFYDCSALINVEMGNNLTAIDTAAFFGCGAMKKIDLPDSVEKFGELVFGCCYELTEFSVPPKVTEIPAGLFSFCENIPELRFGEQVTAIGEGAFEGCNDLKVYIEGAETTLGEDIFAECGEGSRKVYCKKGSVAEKYLKENKIKYAELKD